MVKSFTFQGTLTRGTQHLVAYIRARLSLLRKNDAKDIYVSLDKCFVLEGPSVQLASDNGSQC